MSNEFELGKFEQQAGRVNHPGVLAAEPGTAHSSPALSYIAFGDAQGTFIKIDRDAEGRPRVTCSDDWDDVGKRFWDAINRLFTF